MNTATVSFVVDTTDAAIPLGFEAWLDDDKFFDSEHVQQRQKISTDIDDSDAEHELRLVLKNKTTEHTRVDAENNIVHDVCLTVENLSFGGINLDQILIGQAVYTHDFNGSGTVIQDKFYGPLGCNGTVTLKFTTPIYLWLLEHM
jgi:hypothetical protein